MSAGYSDLSVGLFPSYCIFTTNERFVKKKQFDMLFYIMLGWVRYRFKKVRQGYNPVGIGMLRVRALCRGFK